MAVSEKIKKYLDKERVGYQILQHSLAYTALEIAGAQHLPGKQIIKSVIIKNKKNGKFFMCVLSSIHRIDFNKLKAETGMNDLELAQEPEINKIFPDFEAGAEPPFGHLYGLEVYVDRAISENDEIVFNAGTHTDTVKIKYRDFERLTHPKIADFSQHI